VGDCINLERFLPIATDFIYDTAGDIHGKKLVSHGIKIRSVLHTLLVKNKISSSSSSLLLLPPPPASGPVSLCAGCTSDLGLLCSPKHSIQHRFNNPVPLIKRQRSLTEAVLMSFGSAVSFPKTLQR
jgi:hypothetical protein